MYTNRKSKIKFSKNKSANLIDFTLLVFNGIEPMQRTNKQTQELR